MVPRRYGTSSRRAPNPVAVARLFVVASLFACTAAHAEAPAPREVYLIQDSGWMEPFFDDPKSPFRPLLQAFILRSALPGAEVTVASFNQEGQLPGRPSPLTLFSAHLDQAALSAALGKLDLPKRANNKYTDADFNGALSDTIAKLLSRQSGVIWMITNNKNSRSNDQHVVENTSRFSSQLTDSDYIGQVLAYPLRLPAQGQDFSEKGLVIYGIAYGAPAIAWLQEATRTPAMRSLMVSKPVRIKPLTQDPLRLTLAGTGRDGVHLAPEGNGITISGVGGSGAHVEIPARLTSDYYPQVITQATMSAQWIPSGGGPAIPVSISPQQISAMGPDETLDGVRIRLDLPPIARAPGLAGLLEGERRISGRLRLQLTDVRLALAQPFIDKMRDLFANDADRVGSGVMQLDGRQSTLPSALPAVFLGDEAVAAAATDVPVRVTVAFSALPLILLIGTLAATLLAAAAALVMLRRERRYTIPVGAETLVVSVRPFRSTTLRSRGGVRVAVTGRLLGRPKVVTIT